MYKNDVHGLMSAIVRPRPVTRVIVDVIIVCLELALDLVNHDKVMASGLISLCLYVLCIY